MASFFEVESRAPVDTKEGRARVFTSRIDPPTLALLLYIQSIYKKESSREEEEGTG